MKERPRKIMTDLSRTERNAIKSYNTKFPKYDPAVYFAFVSRQNPINSHDWKISTEDFVVFHLKLIVTSLKQVLFGLKLELLEVNGWVTATKKEKE